MNDSVAKSFTSWTRDKGPEFWLALIKRIFIDTPKYVVKGIPSLAKQQEDTRSGLNYLPARNPQVRVSRVQFSSKGDITQIKHLKEIPPK
jgi:hypothetical protein